MNPMWSARQRASSVSRIDEMTRPSMLIRPCVGVSIPAIRFRSVVLPDPDGPIRAMNSPVSMVRSMSSSTGMLRESRRYALETCSIAIRGWATSPPALPSFADLDPGAVHQIVVTGVGHQRLAADEAFFDLGRGAPIHAHDDRPEHGAVALHQE